MGPLLVITGTLLAASGLIKVRSGLRAGVGVPGLAVVEILFGAGSGAIAIMGEPAVAVAGWFVPVGVGLVIVSSILFALKLGDARRRREVTEGKRLENFVKHLSRD